MEVGLVGSEPRAAWEQGLRDSLALVLGISGRRIDVEAIRAGSLAVKLQQQLE